MCSDLIFLFGGRRRAGVLVYCLGSTWLIGLIYTYQTALECRICMMSCERALIYSLIKSRQTLLENLASPLRFGFNIRLACNIRIRSRLA